MIQNQNQTYKQPSSEIDVSQTSSLPENIKNSEKKSKALKITVISVSVLLVIGAVFLTLFLTGVFSTTQEAQQSCPGRNQEYSNDCACKQGYYQRNENKKESDCIGPFKEDIFSKEAIRLSLEGQEDNAAVRVATENLYQIYKYQVETYQTNQVNESITTAETKQMHIEHDVHVVTTEVTETYFKVIAFANVSSFQSPEDEEPQIVTGYPDSLEQEDTINEEDYMTPQEILDFLAAWQEQEATDMGIEFEDYISSNLPMAQVIINKDGSIQSLEVPVNMRSDFAEILINFFNHYSPILNNFNEESSEQIDMGSGSRRVLSESSDDDVVIIQINNSDSQVSDGTTPNYDTVSEQESQMQSGLVTNSNETANMNLYNGEESNDNLYDYIDVQQIVTCYVVSYEVVSDEQVLQIQEHFDNIYTVLLNTDEYEIRREAWKEFEQLQITGETVEGEEIIVTQEPDNSDAGQEDASSGRRNLSTDLFNKLNFNLFEKYIFGAKIRAYNTFECEEGNDVNDCRLQPYIYIAGLKVSVSGADFQFDSSNGGISKTINLLNKTLFDKSFGKTMYYMTPIGIPFYVKFSLDMSSSLQVSVTFSTNMDVSLDANLNANATLSAEGGVTAAVAKVGAYCDADLFDGNVDLQVYLDFSPSFSGLVRGDISVSALNIRAGIFAQYAKVSWKKKCVGKKWWKVCVKIPQVSYSSRIDLIDPLIINGVSKSWNLFNQSFS